jgi:hypothetical protein
MTIVYQAVGSCTAIDAVLADGDLQGTAVYWTEDEDGLPVEHTCATESGTKADLALSDVNVSTCTGEERPDGFGEFSSMVQGFGFVVPPSSSQQAITATEGQFLFEYGGEEGNEVSPWTEPSSVVIRNPASSTQLLIGLEVGVPGTQWSSNLENDAGGSGGVIEQVAAQDSTGAADETIGILSLQRYDQVRDEVRMLAFEAFGQECLGAVYPDSTPNAFDKQNVRDGHYTIWGYLWSVAAVDDDDAVVGENAARLIDFIGGTEAINGADPIVDAALAGGIPACAMSVRRTEDGGPLEAFSPDDPCGCFFEQVVTEDTSCESCEDDDECESGSCHFGFCEMGGE